MLVFLLRSVTLFCSSGLLNPFFSVLVASAVVSLVYRLFTVREVYNG